MFNFNEIKANNKKVLGAYEDLQYIFDKSNSLDSITEALVKLEQELDTKNKALKYSNTILYLGLLIAILIGAIIMAITDSFLGFALLIPVYFVLRVKKHSNDKFIDLIINKKNHYSYNFEKNKFLGAETSDSITINFSQYFKQGNHLNEIDQVLSGEFRAEFIDIPYSIYRYHYVDVSKDRNGKRQYAHRYNHGVILYDVDASAFSIESKNSKRSNYRLKIDSSDNQFNKKYSVKGTDEMHLGKIFKPSFLVKIMDLFKSDLGINYIYSHNRLPVLIFDVNMDNIFKVTHGKEKLNTVEGIKNFMNSIKMPEYDVFLKNEELYKIFYNEKRGAI